jgi:hypothetical protein
MADPFDPVNSVFKRRAREHAVRPKLVHGQQIVEIRLLDIEMDRKDQRWSNKKSKSRMGSSETDLVAFALDAETLGLFEERRKPRVGEQPALKALSISLCLVTCTGLHTHLAESIFGITLRLFASGSPSAAPIKTSGEPPPTSSGSNVAPSRRTPEVVPSFSSSSSDSKMASA